MKVDNFLRILQTVFTTLTIGRPKKYNIFEIIRKHLNKCLEISQNIFNIKIISKKNVLFFKLEEFLLVLMFQSTSCFINLF